jgi:hypothetical protein
MEIIFKAIEKGQLYNFCGNPNYNNREINNKAIARPLFN